MQCSFPTRFLHFSFLLSSPQPSAREAGTGLQFPFLRLDRRGGTCQRKCNHSPYCSHLGFTFPVSEVLVPMPSDHWRSSSYGCVAFSGPCSRQDFLRNLSLETQFCLSDVFLVMEILLGNIFLQERRWDSGQDRWKLQWTQVTWNITEHQIYDYVAMCRLGTGRPSLYHVCA